MTQRFLSQSKSRIFVSSICATLLFTSCSGSNKGFFGVGGDKTEEKTNGQTQQPAKQPEQQKPVTPIQQQPQQPQQPAQPRIQPTPYNPQGYNPVPPPVLPAPSAVPPLRPIPQGPERNIDDGSVKFAVFGILNQDTQYQITNNYRLQVYKSSGELVASATVDAHAIVRGESADAGGGDILTGKAFVLNAPLVYLAQGPQEVSSGSQQAMIDICPIANASAPFNVKADCLPIQNQGHSNGINHITGAQAAYHIDGKTLKIDSITGAGSYGYGAGSSTIPTVALAHPSAAFAFRSAKQVGRDYGSPLVLDLSKQGKLDLISAFDPKRIIKFDVSGQGEAVRTGWIGKQAGLLAIDLNSNGKIDNGTELFGEFSKRTDADLKSVKQFENGFAALAQYDTKNLGYIDSSNPIFSKLVVWVDANSNGISEKSELKTLAQLGITRIDTTYQETVKGQKDIAGNKVYFSSKYHTKDGMTHAIADVYFQLRTARTVAEIMNDKK